MRCICCWSACICEFSSSVYLLSFKTSVQSILNNNDFRNCPLLVCSLGHVSNFFVCLFLQSLHSQRTWSNTCQGNRKLSVLFHGLWKLYGGHQPLDNKRLLLLWRQIWFWSFILVCQIVSLLFGQMMAAKSGANSERFIFHNVFLQPPLITILIRQRSLTSSSESTENTQCEQHKDILACLVHPCPPGEAFLQACVGSGSWCAGSKLI